MEKPFEKPVENVTPITPEAGELKPDNEFFGIKVEGDEGFLKRTQEALKMLAQLPEFLQIKPHIGLIRRAERSGMRAYDEIPTYEVADPTSSHSTIWYASTIAHDGFHSLLYHQGKERSKGREPDADLWTGTQAEKQCLEFQLKVLEQLTTEKYLLDYAREYMKDPKYQGGNRSREDYQKRNW